MSARAALSAIDNELTNVAALKGGWAAWTRANYPVEPTQRPAPTRASGTPTPAGDAGPPASEQVPGVLGSGDAPVIMVEFSDYQCPYCGRYVAETLPKIIENYVDTGQVRYVFRDLPLPNHDKAQQAATAARCAGAQGAYWEMHDRLYGGQGEWTGRKLETALAKFVGYAEDLELDVEAFEVCLQAGEFVEAIAQDVEQAEQWGLRGTPSFLINGQPVVGAYPYEHFEAILEAALEDQQ